MINFNIHSFFTSVIKMSNPSHCAKSRNKTSQVRVESAHLEIAYNCTCQLRVKSFLDFDSNWRISILIMRKKQHVSKHHAYNMAHPDTSKMFPCTNYSNYVYVFVWESSTFTCSFCTMPATHVFRKGNSSLVYPVYEIFCCSPQL